jgi:phosphoenolpyruvate-protein phosphotransferase/dihydroxyacetone kinase phosphotransfer subunit
VVGLVIVSHSAALAEGVSELAREMGGGKVAIEPAGGMEDGAIGTDAERVREAVERVRSPDGVLILMDLGSALMSAEMATEMAEPDGGPIRLSEAPLVEGAVAAAALAGAGAELDEVAREARGALRMKAEQLDVEEDDAAEPAGADDDGPGHDLRLRVHNRLGLHARPAARFVSAVGGLDASVEVRNVTRSRGPANGRSLVGLATLAVAQGDEILVHASGSQGEQALEALRALAAENFGDAEEDGNAAEPTPEPEPEEPQTPGEVAAGSRLSGVPASPGIAIGPARRLTVRAPVVEDDEPAGSPEEERARLDEARAAAREELEQTHAEVLARAGAEAADIFSAHAVLLDDAAITEPAQRLIGDGAGAARAWQSASEEAAAAFRALDDPYLQERGVDVEDVSRRVLAQLGSAPQGAALEGPGIVLADELTPGEAAGLDSNDAWAIATARGGATAHAAILARALGIPAVVGLGEAVLQIPEGTQLVLDGEAGVIEVDPGEDAVAERRATQEAADEERRALEARAAEPGALEDGRRVEVFANIGSAAEAARAVEQGAEGVGLLRTEFLFLDRATPPDEDEQVAVLTEIAEALDGRPVVVRTLDAGADKPLPFLRQEPEDNPFLGRRGIRLSLAQPDLFRTQLRAILRVAEDHPLKVMFPMVATLDELHAARELLDEARSDLGSGAELELGVMVEVPALALQAEQFAPEVDFFSVGTNDLAQYTMAAERGNAALAGLLDESLAPVLALIADVVGAADSHGRWVGVCGELAGRPDAAVLLAGLGVRELSMAASRIPAVKAALRETDTETAAAAARRVLPAGRAPVESARASWQRPS